jgi:MFS family permease
LSSDQNFRSGGLVVSTLFITLGLLYGIWYSYSVFLVALIDQFGWSRSVTAGAMSVFIVTHGLFGPFAGRLVEKFGPTRLMMVGSLVMAAGLLLTSQINQWWQLYISFGVITAVGLGACGWVPSVILSERWFPHKVGTALGIVTAGIGVGIFTVVPFTNYLIETVQWRAAFQVLGATVVFLIWPAAFFILRLPTTEEHSEQASNSVNKSSINDSDKQPSWTVATAVRSRSFRFCVLAFFTGGCLSQLLILHQFAFMVDHGVAKTIGSIVVGIIGVASIPGKIVWGALSDRIGRELTYTFGLTCTLASVVVLSFVGSVPGLFLPVLFAVLLGVGYSANAPIIPSVTRDLFAGPRFPSIFGTLSMFAAMGGATGSWLGGYLFDISGGYQLMLMAAAAMAIFGPIMLWLAAPRNPESPPPVVANSAA